MKKIALFIIILGIVVGVIYPLYVVYTFRSVGEKFAKTINSHNLKEYDAYFSDDTIFIAKGKQYCYMDIRETFVKKDFYIEGVYSTTDIPWGFEYLEYFTTNEFNVGLHGGIYTNYAEQRYSTGIDGVIRFRRHGGLIFKIVEVDLNSFYDDESSESYKLYNYIFSEE